MNLNTPKQDTTLQRIHDRIVQGRYWTYSLLIHAVLLAIISSFVIRQMNEPAEPLTGTWQGDNSAEYQISTKQDVPERPPETDPNPTKIEKPATPEYSQVPPKGSVITTAGPSNVKVTIDTNSELLRGLGTVDVPLAPKGLPADYIGRFIKDGSGMIGIGKTLGSGPKPPIESEKAVLRGLRWLRDNQNDNGSWGQKNVAGMTGLALLCFLGHGETGDSKEFGLCVNKAIDWVLKNGTENQGRLSMTKDNWGPGNGGVYEHGIVTYALGEYYTLTNDGRVRDERVLELLKQAIGHITAGQAPDGGWMYHFDKTQSDTSVSGWQVQALKAAHLTKLDLPGVDAALDKAMANFDRVQGPNGGYGYRGPEDRYSLTGVGLLCEKFWGRGRNKDLHKSVEFIRDKSDKEFPVKYQGEAGDLYAWYYHTQAMLMMGGAAWRDWERKFQQEIITAQSPVGSWPVMRSAGHGNLQNEASLTGAVYRTTLSVLILESYYRYMPTNRADIGAGVSGLALR